MDLPEYYLPRSEREALLNAQDRILEHFQNGPMRVIDLGAGDGSKTQLVLASAIQKGIDTLYHPVDISPSALEGLVRRLSEDLPELKLQGWLGKYEDAFERMSAQRRAAPALVMFLGSNIGNFAPQDSEELLRSLGDAMGPQDIALVGFDTKKEESLMHAAYDDSQGVTAAFNLNLLRRINRELDGDFDLSAFRHRACYNREQSRMESYLVSEKAQQVSIGADRRRFDFAKGETIHTECSYKYSLDDIGKLAKKSGLQLVEIFQDENRWFADAVLRA